MKLSIIIALTCILNVKSSYIRQETSEFCKSICQQNIEYPSCDCSLTFWAHVKDTFYKWWNDKNDHLGKQGLIKVDIDNLMKIDLTNGDKLLHDDSHSVGNSFNQGTTNNTVGGNGGSGGSSGGGSNSNGGRGNGSGSGMSPKEKFQWLLKQDKTSAMANFKKAVEDCQPNESKVYLYFFPNGDLSHFNCTQPTTMATTIIPTTPEDVMAAFCHDACLSGNGGVSCSCAQHPIG